MNKVENTPLEKKEQGTLREPYGLKDIIKGYNGQEVDASTSVDTRCTRNDKDQLRQHSGMKGR